MNRSIFFGIVLLFIGFGFKQANAQIASASDNLVAQSIANRTVSFCIPDTGVSKVINWGLDLAWLDEVNIRRGIGFMGVDGVDIVRSSFRPTEALLNGELVGDPLEILIDRMDIIDTYLGSDSKVMLNCDHPSVDPWYQGNAANWAAMIDATVRQHQARGHVVVSVAPFNEPDYSATGQGSISDFYDIAGALRQNPLFDDIRICGGNTLNTDEALNWYDFLKDRLDEGNTHQLAGSFSNYADFYEAVEANGHHATNDELHNVMEAMVGVEYGLNTGIWWGTAELARGEFVKASDGRRLAYAEHRSNWTAASVYRSPEGKVQAFGGSSERQAKTTTYRFVSEDRDVYYDGYGPQREYIMEIPGGTGYQQGQSNAERMINITWGDDIQPVINGRYVIVNRNSGKVIEIAGASLSAGANLQQGTSTDASFQQWDVTPVDAKIGGDFSYFTINSVHSNMSPDIFNWSLDNGGNIAMWNSTYGTNQQWYLEYVEDGWFNIRSRYSAKCLEVINSNTYDGANIVHWDKDGGTNQQWRFLPVGAAIEFDPPSAPDGLVASANAESIRLDWSASQEVDVASYSVFRSTTAGGPYNTIARNVKSSSFIDNTCTTGGPYFYSIKAVDSSLNKSAYSKEASATPTGNKAMVAYYQFEGNTLDSSINLNHSAPYGDISFDSIDGFEAIELNGTESFIQLPSNLATQDELTIATWVYWTGRSSRQPILDFSNSEGEGLSLTAEMALSLNMDNEEKKLNAPMLPLEEWTHVAVTLGESGASLFINGELEDESAEISVNLLDIRPMFNYIGRGKYSLFSGYIDDFRVYNYALSPEELAGILELDDTTSTSEAEASWDHTEDLTIWPVPANDELHVNLSKEVENCSGTLNIYNSRGSLVLSEDIINTNYTGLTISNLASGMYMLKWISREETKVKKFIISH